MHDPEPPSATPETPEVPDVPSVPDVPDVPSAPEVPDVPSVPEVPDVPSAPDIPEMPSVPEVPGVSSVPDGGNVAHVADAADVPPEVADVPAIPESPEISEVVAVAPEQPPATVAPAVAEAAVAASIAMDQGMAEAAATVTAARDAQLAASRAKAGEAWQRVVAAHASGDTLPGAVVSIVKGGALVDIGGIRGFLPASQVRAPEGQTLDALLKTVLPLKILDIDATRRRAVVSARRAIEAERRRKRSELLASLAPGQRREAVVMRLTEFGAFVDLGGVDGLIPMSELALERVERASDAVTVGERLEVEVLRVDAGGKKISLSRKNALPDPWRDHAALLRVGNVVEGKVVAKEPRLSIELAPGIVGTMRDSDANPADYEIGETVEVAIRIADRRSRRLTLASPYAATATLSQSRRVRAAGARTPQATDALRLRLALARFHLSVILSLSKDRAPLDGLRVTVCAPGDMNVIRAPKSGFVFAP